MFHLVTTDGRYHGEVADENAAKQLESVQKNKQPGYFRLINDETWQKTKDASNRGETWTAEGKVL